MGKRTKALFMFGEAKAKTEITEWLDCQKLQLTAIGV